MMNIVDCYSCNIFVHNLFFIVAIIRFTITDINTVLW